MESRQVNYPEGELWEVSLDVLTYYSYSDHLFPNLKPQLAAFDNKAPEDLKDKT